VIRAGAALARDEDPARAGTAAAEKARAVMDSVDSALVFATGYGKDGQRAALSAMDVLGARAVAGAAGHGVLAGGEDEEEQPAVAVLALAGVGGTPFRLPDLAGAEDAAGAELEAALGRSAGEGDLVVLFADPLAADVRRLLRACDDVLPPGSLVGAAAAIGPDGRPGLAWSGREALAGGACGLVLHLPGPARVLLSHGCRPITEPLPVTRADGHWVLELAERPALDVYREAAGALLAADLRRTAELVLVALPRGRTADAFVVRTVAGFDPERRAFALAEDVRPGTPLRLALRDADLAREDLARALAGAGTPAAAALYLSCPGRGRSLFRHAGLETAFVAHALGATPLAGLFGSFQFGPVAGVTELHTYAAVLALL
jgi:small ligand-binding sensory domain FIST